MKTSLTKDKVAVNDHRKKVCWSLILPLPIPFFCFSGFKIIWNDDNVSHES